MRSMERAQPPPGVDLPTSMLPPPPKQKPTSPTKKATPTLKKEWHLIPMQQKPLAPNSETLTGYGHLSITAKVTSLPPVLPQRDNVYGRGEGTYQGLEVREERGLSGLARGQPEHWLSPSAPLCPRLHQPLSLSWRWGAPPPY